MTRNIGIKVPVPKNEADDGDQKILLTEHYLFVENYFRGKL